MIKVEITAQAVAWYGAIVSTIAVAIGGVSAFIHYLSYKSDQPRVKLRCRDGIRVAGQHFDAIPYKKDTDYICVSVINVGKRPVTIGNVGCIPKNRRKDKSFIFTDALLRGSREIKEGKAEDYMIEEASIDKKKIRHFVAYDLTGREYKGTLEKSK